MSEDKKGLLCHHCNKPLGDSKAHPEGRFCQVCHVSKKLKTDKKAHPNGEYCKKPEAADVTQEPIKGGGKFKKNGNPGKKGEGKG